MKITVTTSNGKHTATVPFYGAEYVTANGTCPSCGNQMRCSGLSGTRERTRNTITEVAICRHCNKIIGTISVSIDTIFGIEEDERVLYGPYKVY